MRIHPLLRVLFVAVVSTLIAASLLGSAAQELAEQVITVSDTRTGTGPCGFPVQRDLEGTITVTPRIDDAGQLVLTIGKVDIDGRVTNMENGKSVDIHWVQQNSGIGFATNGTSIDVMLGIDGTMSRGYDTGDVTLSLDLPSDEAKLTEFTPGDRHEDPWAHVCGLLA